MTVNHKKLLSVEKIPNLNLHNNLTLFTVFFLVTSHNWPSPPPNIFLVSLAEKGI